MKKTYKVTSKNSIFKNLVATLRAGSSFKVPNTSSIRHFSFLPSLGLTQIFFTKAIFRGSHKTFTWFGMAEARRVSAFPLFLFLSLLLLASCSRNGNGPSEEVPAPEYGTVTDARDGREYRTVKIGEQWWMAENLDYAVDSSWCLNDDADFCLVYGRLYQWTAAMNLDTVYLTRNAKPDGLVKTPHQGICPDGWHVPSNREFVKLYRYAEDFYGSEGVGSSLKSESGWASGYGENPGTDKFGFNFKPGGMRIDDGTYWFDGQEDGVMMTSTEVGEKDHADIAYLWMFFYNGGVSSIDGSYTKRYATSLRCIKD